MICLHKKVGLLMALTLMLWAQCLLPSAYAQDWRSYTHYLDLGYEAYEANDFEAALMYFTLAESMAPTEANKKSIKQIIDVVKQSHDIEVSESRRRAEAVLKEQMREKDAGQEFLPVVKPEPEKEAVLTRAPDKPLAATQEIPAPKRQSKHVVAPTIYVTHFEEAPESLKGVIRAKDEVIDMDDSWWQLQPDTKIYIEINSSAVLRFEGLKNFLVVSPEFITAQEPHKDHIKILAHKLGSSFLHIWDERGRWTFHVDVVLPPDAYVSEAELRKAEGLEEHAPPFSLAYSTYWSSYYRGDRFELLERQSLNYSQYVSAAASTPYGHVDGFATFVKFEDSIERIQQGVGLTDGHIGPFKDFRIRGWDTYVEFSPLSLPSRSFRGILLDAYAFGRKVRYITFRGQDRATYLFVTPSLLDVRKSYLEGTKVTLFPDEANSFSLNYAYGWGDIRPRELKKKVFSFDTKHDWGRFHATTDIGFDTDEYAGMFTTRFEADDYTLRVNFRDIDKQYYNIVSRPINQGEVGGNIVFSTRNQPFDLRANLDIYHDRLFPNPDQDNGLNYDLNGSLGFPVTDTSRFQSSYFYSYTPQNISPRRNIQINNVYTQRFKLIGNRTLSAYLGATYQRYRFENNESSDFDRYAARTGLRLPLTRRLSYFLNYEFSWVRDGLTKDLTRPNVLTTGLSYSQSLTDTLTAYANLDYRKEQDSSGRFSYLAGEDSLRAHLGFNYHPTSDIEFFIDGQVDNVWALDDSGSSFRAVDVRFGVRTNWELPFRWDPAARISGIVYKDQNGNAQLDAGEAGIPGVNVLVGTKKVRTSRSGTYSIKVRAKSVRVTLDPKTVPKGYFFSTEALRDITIEHLKDQTVDFGMRIQTTISGNVFYDINNNGRIDPAEPLINGVVIILDDDLRSTTDEGGGYVFDNVKPGKHTIRLDVNTLPLEYLPLIKVVNEITVAEGASYIFRIPVTKK